MTDIGKRYARCGECGQLVDIDAVPKPMLIWGMLVCRTCMDYSRDNDAVVGAEGDNDAPVHGEEEDD